MKTNFENMQIISNENETALRQTTVISRFSVGDTVNYCNGLIFKIVRINENNGVCYDQRGMWYALSNCVKVS